ncbi:EboA domain-containing protein [Streptomyces azureus]|uniref:Sugar phosphate isomerase/epimerase n=1 Tax=Streptomyces azureus TaxID=146537 RepID=A0A0K8PYC2_STRAJ|nr:EboA domain-containing protein [Streptomyces azureus]GAP52733.1 sugar phosphate isomerase/epimerase [Streptomyces azureus]
MTAVHSSAPSTEQDARDWLARACAAAAAGDPGWELRFAEAGRRCRALGDAARVDLLTAARPAAATVTRLYRQGTAAERRAVLLALPRLDPVPAYGVPLVEDALRTNDTSLLTAAVGPYAARHLDAHAWRHAVLKCLFTGVPVSRVFALADRARGDEELARMLRAFAGERTAAGREVPEDLHHVLALTEEER